MGFRIFRNLQKRSNGTRAKLLLRPGISLRFGGETLYPIHVAARLGNPEIVCFGS